MCVFCGIAKARGGALCQAAATTPPKERERLLQSFAMRVLGHLAIMVCNCPLDLLTCLTKEGIGRFEDLWKG